MTRSGPVGVGVVGCGTISNEYLRTMAAFPDLRVAGVADLDPARAEAKAAAHGVPFAGTTAELLARDDVELVVNLTIPAAHAEVGRQAIAAGKHLWNEKPIATDPADARALLAEADEAGVLIGVAPDTVLGAGVQSARRMVERGDIGRPLSVLTLLQIPGPERWHPSPEFLYARGAGPLFDIGPYSLTTLVHLLGSFVRVSALGRRSVESRVIATGPRAGTRFPVEVPTYVALLAETDSGAAATMVFSFESPLTRTGFVEITGTEATLAVPDPNRFDGDVRMIRAGDSEWTTVPAEGPTHGRGLGALDLARAIRSGGRPRASGTIGAHVLDVMVAVESSIASGQPVSVPSRAERPPAVPEDWQPTAATL